MTREEDLKALIECLKDGTNPDWDGTVEVADNPIFDWLGIPQPPPMRISLLEKKEIEV